MEPLERHSHSRRWPARIAFGFVLLVLTIAAAWAVAALYFDFPVAGLRIPLALLYAAVWIAALVVVRKRSMSPTIAVGLVGFGVVLIWWLSLTPSNDRNWQPDVAQTPWAEIEGDRVTVHNLRNCDYRTETDYTCAWETREFDLSQLRGVDIFITWWGSPWIAHPILSFDFGDGKHLPISIETRDVVGQSYSAIRGFFRQYELAYVVSDERDVIRLRTNYRKGEDVYLFHTTATPEQARGLLLQYLGEVNRIHQRPEWYNALTNNCTTNIAEFSADSRKKRVKWDWRILLNGKGDEMMYEHGQLAADLPLAELKQRAYINPAAQAANDAPDFSARIRAGRPGFSN